MTYPKFLAIATLLLFVVIAALAFLKKNRDAPPLSVAEGGRAQQLAAESSSRTMAVDINPEVVESTAATGVNPAFPKPREQEVLPTADRVQLLFNVCEPKLPIVETVSYKSKVAWLKGRPAWLADYASYYATSRHFIARSLNGKANYLKQDLREGDRFNVFRRDKKLAFHMLIDLSRCKMWFYYLDLDKGERVLLKTYDVGVGRIAPERSSGLLTPFGKYLLGDKVAIYNNKSRGTFNNESVEMIKIFGTRWIPFESEIGECTAPARGLGLHGVPWVVGDEGALVEDISSLGQWQSDGCVRLATADIEELYAIVLTRPTVVELVKDYNDAQLDDIENFMRVEPLQQ